MSRRMFTRRAYLQGCSLGWGWLAWQGLAAGDAGPSAVLPHVAPRAKRVIFLFMDGGVSHVDSFDPKPMLTERSGQPAKWRPDTRSQAVSAGRKWLGSPWKFRQHGQSGLWVSSLFPKAAEIVDDLCVIRSMIGETPLHGAQSLLLHTGRSIAAAPSIGSWISWGLGRENEQLPGYVLLNNDWIPNGGFQNFASSFLPAMHQAALVRAKGTPVDNIVPADSPDLQQAKLAFLQGQDRLFADRQGVQTRLSLRFAIMKPLPGCRLLCPTCATCRRRLQRHWPCTEWIDPIRTTVCTHCSVCERDDWWKPEFALWK